MKIRLIPFTNQGRALAGRIAAALTEYEAEIRTGDTPLAECCRQAFERREPLVFIGASGIAVRAIAPFVRDKLSDPPVIVLDERGRFAIPLLSGHMGGANELAQEIAAAVSAVPVITTATDINGAFSVDVFAKENGLRIANRDGIAKVSSSALEGKPVTICIREFPPREAVDVLISDADSGAEGALRDAASVVLCPKRYAVGIGCRKGKTFEELRVFAERVLRGNGIDPDEIGCIATIDIKKEEAGLRSLSQYWRAPLITFDAALLAKAEGEFASSERVLGAVGVDNVCERAAALAAGRGAGLVVRKTAENGMTCAVAEARKKWKGKGPGE